MKLDTSRGQTRHSQFPPEPKQVSHPPSKAAGDVGEQDTESEEQKVGWSPSSRQLGGRVGAVPPPRQVLLLSPSSPAVKSGCHTYAYPEGLCKTPKTEPGTRQKQHTNSPQLFKKKCKHTKREQHSHPIKVSKIL